MATAEEKYDTHRMLYGTQPNPVIEALFLLNAHEKETLPDACRRIMRELGQEPGALPVSWDMSKPYKGNTAP